MKPKSSSNTFCTIITANYIHYALALYSSIQKYNKTIKLCVLVSDTDNLNLPIKEDFTNLKIYSIRDLCQEGIGKEIYQKYGKTYMDGFRWSMKSVFIKFLLEEKGYEKVIWADPDLFFVGDYQFLFDELDQYNVLLTPHWRSINPQIEKEHFDYLFVGGLYNAGFVAVNKNGSDIMEWWSKMCLYECVIDFSRGQYVDQTYLNLLPIYFDKVKVLKHRGCNISEWNKHECKRTLDKKGNVLINHKWKPIFLHLTGYTIRDIHNMDDPSLKPYLDQWYKIIKTYKSDFKLITPKRKIWKRVAKKIQSILKLKP